MEKKITKEQKLKQENNKLKKALAICLNRPLLNEIKGALVRINKGSFVDEDEFFKQSPLKSYQ